jgi:hypothetical protein
MNSVNSVNSVGTHSSAKKISSVYQNMIYGVIVLAVGTVFYTLRPTYSYEPHGIFLPEASPSSPSSNTSSNKDASQLYPRTDPSQVNFLESAPTNAEFQSLGKISVFTHFDSTSPAEIDEILMAQKNYIQQMAASHGANAVIISMAGKSPGNPNPLDAVMINATAIKN